MTTPTTAATVSRFLGQRGHRKSEYHPSGMIKGWGSSTSGFEASTLTGGRVMIKHIHGDWSRMRDMSERLAAERSKLDDYENSLRTRYETERFDDGKYVHIIVKGKKT